MRKLPLLASVLLMLCMFMARPAGAQATTEDHSLQDPRIHESLLATAGGGLTFNLENSGSQAITACVFREQMPAVNGRPGGVSVSFMDRVYSPHPSPRQLALNPAPNQTGSLVLIPDQLSGKIPRPAEFSLMAVVFEDGSSAGDPTWVSAILERRKAHLQALSQAVTMLQAVQAGTESTDQLVSDMQAKRSALGRTPNIANQPVQWGQWAAQAEIYNGVPNMLKAATSPDRAKAIAGALLADYSTSIQRIQASKPAVTSQ